MPKTDHLELDDYAPVADRIELFYVKYPTGRITTKLLPASEREVVVKAFVYRQAEDKLPAATGLASERIGDGEINMHSCLENTETSAIGRALANLGFAASRRRPSREEMDKVERARASVGLRKSVREQRTMSTEPLPTPVVQSAIHIDSMELLERAERLGLSSARVAMFRTRLSDAASISLASSMKLERSLRNWVVRKSRSRVHPV
ncbi:MAG TPA: hypothetical protein VFP26_12695 [Gemmatimonadaceae bacterium]|jgi:hypothetical protein|nr:hypothetical protein [Gemmatimonadaceae bacterium]